MTLLDSMPHTVTLQRRTVTQDSLGGDRETWTNFDTLVEAWVQLASANSIIAFEKRGQQISHIVYFNEDPSLNEQCRIVYGSQVFDFVATADRSAGLGVLFGAAVMEVTNRENTA